MPIFVDLGFRPDPLAWKLPFQGGHRNFQEITREDHGSSLRISAGTIAAPTSPERMQHPSPGQRWISTSEPSLGIGEVRSVREHQVEIRYPAVEETRLYAIESAPLVRVHFSPGDVISERGGHPFTVERTTLHEGIISYHGGGRQFDETHLSDTLTFLRPESRLLAGLCDHPRDFDLRVEALGWNMRLRQSPTRGFTGARIDLIPHQLAIVAETAGRLHPRVLLADEVGLGKTIEACLILHRLHLTGHAARILILVPEPLVHQWFIELLRRFNLLFAIFDEARCLSIEAHDPDSNPFLDSQLILASTDFPTGRSNRAEQARAAGFDLLIVDEAHHLEWSPGQPSAEYAMVESFAKETPSLLLLTATPQQLGPAGHFARLRLLDPERYADYESFLEEAESYVPLAEAVASIRNGTLPLDLDFFTSRSPRAAIHWAALLAGDSSASAPLVAELIDFFGTGRVLFRNTRDRLSGFPVRHPHLHPLTSETSPYRWLANLLRSLPETEKILLITHSPDDAISVQKKLLGEVQVETALFHEDLTLLQRDRNAAWFADPEGARILICSEIGSEGRNFQFARQLVLFGLPLDPEQLEQRIGRLDRIGQTGPIHIHVPYGVNSRSEYHARWFHEGLDAFSRPLKGAATLAATLLPELEKIQAAPVDLESFKAFLRRSRDLRDQVAAKVVRGHDRLLAPSAAVGERAALLLEKIQTADRETRFERFSIKLLDHLGLDVTELSERTYHLHRGQRHSEVFADLPAEGLSGTFDRETALAREDLAFLTGDHPVILGALEHLVDGESGNASFAHWAAGKGKAILLECIFVLELLAQSRLHLDRFMPPTVFRVVVDHHGTPIEEIPPAAVLTAGDPNRLIRQETFRRELFPKMLDAARNVASTAIERPVQMARELAARVLTEDLDRLQDLAARNSQVSQMEIDQLRSSLDQTLAALSSPRLRLDAIRLIWRT